MAVNLINKITVNSSRLLNKTLKSQSFINHQRNMTLNKYKPHGISDESIKSFKFTDYDCIGFDLDNTICKYKVGPMLKMGYEVLSSFLVKQRNYSPKYLLRPMEENLDILMKGLILDFYNGNILKISSNGQIVRASHGTKTMSALDIERQYGVDKHWNVTDAFASNFLTTWNGPLSERMRSLLDYFDMPTILAFARIVDTLDEESGKKLEKYDIWPDLLAALTDMYDIKHFELNKGGYFPNIKKDPNKYIEKCSNHVLNWLKALKQQNKILFLITGSYVDFASLTSETCMGKDWHNLFDIVIFYAKKPGFFTENRPFVSVKTKATVTSDKLKQNEWYIQGNWNDLSKFLSIVSKKDKPKVAYVGDNLIQDIYTPAVYTSCDTVAVVEELEAEEMFGFNNKHEHSEFLSSNIWGSYFLEDNENDTVWLNIIRKYSMLCVPKIDFFATKPIDFKYQM